MKIAKAAAGVAGVAMALGAASPAAAAPEPHDADQQLMDTRKLSTKVLKNPVHDLGVAATVRPLMKTADRLEADRLATTHVTGAARTLSKVADAAGLH